MIYVDRMFACPPTKKWPYPEACHIIADTEKELVEFAINIGLKKEWLQKGTKRKPYTIPHFDLTRSKRKVAIQLGAIEINMKEMARRIKKHRHKVREKNSRNKQLI